MVITEQNTIYLMVTPYLFNQGAPELRALRLNMPAALCFGMALGILMEFVAKPSQSTKQLASSSAESQLRYTILRPSSILILDQL